MHTDKCLNKHALGEPWKPQNNTVTVSCAAWLRAAELRFERALATEQSGDGNGGTRAAGGLGEVSGLGHPGPGDTRCGFDSFQQVRTQ